MSGRPYLPPRPRGRGGFQPYPPMSHPMPGYGDGAFWADDFGPGPAAPFGGYPRYPGPPAGRGGRGFRGRGGPGPMRGRGGHAFRGTGKTTKSIPAKTGEGLRQTVEGKEPGEIVELPPVQSNVLDDGKIKVSGDGTTLPVMISAKPESRFIAGGQMKSFSETVVDAKSFIGPQKPGEEKIGVAATPSVQVPVEKKHFVLAGKPVEAAPGVPSVSAELKRKDPLYNAEESWPDDLMDKFSEFECVLCGSKMNSRLIAKTHYDGKVHEKKLRMYFGAYAQTTGMPIYYYIKRKERKPPSEVEVKPPLLDSAEVKAVDANTHELFCKICQISFTSDSHRTQHELGRNHQRKAAGLPPLKTGYFNPVTGRWHRVPTWESNKRLEEPESSNFAPLGGGGSTQSGNTYATDDGQTLKNLAKLVPAGADTTVKYIFECKLCAVTAPTQAQLDVHLQGQKHRFKMERKEKIEKQLENEKNGVRRPKPYDRRPGGYGGPKVDFTQKWWSTPAHVEHFN